MYFVDAFPDADVYYYECAICKKEVRTTNLKVCCICNKKICDDCDKESFCLDHYKMLSSKGKSNLNQLIEEVKNKKKKVNRWEITLLIISHIFFIYMIILLKWYIIWVLTILYIFIIIPIILPFENKKQKYEKYLKGDKISLFKEYAVYRKFLIQGVERKCVMCGRILKDDSEYCDICGSKI